MTGRVTGGTATRFPGVDIYQYGYRPPSEVLAELVTEAGLREDDITWSSSDQP